MFTKTRTGDGFPDWEIVAAGDRWFDWFSVDGVTELGFVHDDYEWHIAVDDRSRRVIHGHVNAGVLVSSWPTLASVPGLVRVWFGPETYNYDYYVARETSGVAY